MQLNSSLNLMLLTNSILGIGLILNQNESTKESVTNRNSTSSSNPLENFTWGSVIFQFILLLIKTKTTDF